MDAVLSDVLGAQCVQRACLPPGIGQLALCDSSIALIIVHGEVPGSDCRFDDRSVWLPIVWLKSASKQKTKAGLYIATIMTFRAKIVVMLVCKQRLP